MLRTRKLHFPCPNRCGLAKAFYPEPGFPPSHKSSNNPLAVEPETENDIARGKLFRRLTHNSNSIEAAALATATRIYSNDQHVDTCGDAWSGDDSRDFDYCRTCLFPSSQRSAARSHQIAMPLRL